MPIGGGASGISRIRDATDISLSNAAEGDNLGVDSFGAFTNLPLGSPEWVKQNSDGSWPTPVSDGSTIERRWVLWVADSPKPTSSNVSQYPPVSGEVLELRAAPEA